MMPFQTAGLNRKMVKRAIWTKKDRQWNSKAKN